MAQAADKGSSIGGGNTAPTINPYSPAYGAPWRHGAVPSRETNDRMAAFSHAQAQMAAPTASQGRLSYGGGVQNVGVLSGQSKVYLIFYGTQWGTQTTDGSGNLVFSGDSAGAAGAAQKMFRGIGTNGELWSAELTQWCDGNGVASGATSCPASGASYIPYQQNVLAGVWYDNASASPSAATAAQLANEAIRAAAHFGNTTAASNRYTYYVILSPHGTNPDNYQSPTQGYCAWHDYTADAGVSSPYGEMAFSNQPYNIDVGSSCGTNFVNSGSAGTLDGYTMTLGHEWHEMMSDQFPAGGWTNHTGGTYNGQENSDECAWIAAGQTGGAANIAFSTGTFTEQASWSNDTGTCAISHTIVTHGGNIAPVANFNFSTSGLTANFTDTSTDSDGSIASRSWNFGDGGTSTAANPSHTYTTGGAKSVQLTVTDNLGATNSVTKTVTVTAGNVAPVANFTVATSSLTATFTNTSTDSDGTIASSSWNFGDGATSTTSSPSHTYAAAGTYSVALTVTDNGGLTNTKTSSVTVSTSSCGATVLCNGVAKTGLAASTGATLNYTMVVPAGATGLKFVMSGGTGDADLYVKFGSAPTTSSYDCRPYVSGNSETCNIATAQAGTYYVMVRAYSTFSGVSLTGSYTTGTPPGPSFTNNTVMAINDNTTINSTIAVTGVTGAASATLKVPVNITHTYQGDLKIDLIAPNGTTFNLWNRTGGGTDNINQTFTVNASSVTAPNGTWTLRVADQAAGDIGTLNSWGLQF